MAPREGLTGELLKPPSAALIKSLCSERLRKRHKEICQVGIKEMNASELLMRYRKFSDFVKTIILWLLWDKYSGNLFIGCTANGIQTA